MKILIASAWPYANGSLHIGHLAGLLPADIIARYHRAKGNDVYFVSGSDCFGTPVAIRAKQEHRTPEEISERYHHEFCECFRKLGFSYDLYGKTSSAVHQDFVKNFHKKMYGSPFIYEKSVPQAFCESCNTFLADRFVHGICPSCGEEARGDQCDICGSVLEPEALIKPTCSLCGTAPVFRESKHLFIAISKFENQLKELVQKRPNWRKNAIAFTNRYIREGLRDRAVTRDLDWAIWVKDIADRYDPDSLRYFFIANGPERRDSDFSWREYLNSHNSELLGAYGNFVNRNLVFVHKYFDGAIPEGCISEAMKQKIADTFHCVGEKIEKANLKDALHDIFDLVRFGNKYFDSAKPWETRNSDKAACEDTIFHCVQLIANLSVLLAPFLPFSSAKVSNWLKLDLSYRPKYVKGGTQIPVPELLFERLDKNIVEYELSR